MHDAFSDTSEGKSVPDFRKARCRENNISIGENEQRERSRRFISNDNAILQESKITPEQISQVAQIAYMKAGEPFEYMDELMDKSDVTASFNKDTIVQALMEALIDGGISMQATHIEVLLSNQIRSAFNIYGKPNWNNKCEPYQILTLSKSLAENPSITKTLDFQNLGRILKSPSFFEKTATSTIDYFFQEQPQKFMNSPDLVRESNA